jgi:hypothetical protein
MADWLSMKRVTGVCGSDCCQISLSSLYSHTASLAACEPVIYSASVLKSATEGCFFELQLMAPPASMKTYLDIDLRSLTSLAQSASM